MSTDIRELIGRKKKIAVGGHVRPDGDCVGSCMALYNYIVENMQDIDVDVYLEFLPESFEYIKNTDKVKIGFEEEARYDVFIALDCGDVERLGNARKYFESAELTINIDHHISNVKFADKNFVADKSSTCEYLYNFMKKDKISLAVAEALYTGIIHDTGVFKHSCTTKETMRIAGELIEKGVVFSKIIDESFYQKTYVQNQILGRCLLESIMVLDGKCIVSNVSQKVMNFYGADSKDLDGVIDQLRITIGVEVAILIHETGLHQYKVSMRSNNKVDVSKIAVYFGGGGHIKAAGCTMTGLLHDVINNLTRHIENQLLSGN